MSVLIWAALLFSVRSNHAHTGASQQGRGCGDKEHCITLSEGKITAEAGLCVVLPCYFTTADTVKSVIWYKCGQSQTKCDSDIIFDTSNIDKNQTGRVSLLEPDRSKRNCSIIINDLTESDSGSYELRVNGDQYRKTAGFTSSSRTTVSVKDLSSKPTVMVPALTEGQQTTLTCTAPGLCSGSVPTITWMWRGTGENNIQIRTGNITTKNLTAVTQRHSSTLIFNPLSKHHGTQVTCKVSFTGSKITEETVTLNVTHIKITGNTTVKKGDALNLTCSVEGFSPSVITWTKSDSNGKHKGTKTDLQNSTGTNLMNDTRAKLKDDTGTEVGTDTQNKTVTQTQHKNLFIPNINSEHSGRYICTAKHLNTTLTTYADITVASYPKILHNSGCEKSSQSNVVTCVCISQGLPLPNVTLLLVESNTGYSGITTVSKHTVNSTITVSVADHSNTTIKCVSSNYIGKTEVNVKIIINDLEQDDLLWKLLETVKQPQVIIAFLIGILLSATICCFTRKCPRKNQKSSGNLAEILEMETMQALPLRPIDAGQAVEDWIHNQEAAEGEAEAAGRWDVEPKEVEYSAIDFSVSMRKSPAQETQDTAETEYAEIKREETEERQDNGGEETEMLDDNDEVMIEEDKEARRCMLAEEEGGQDVAMCSDVTEILTAI